MFKSFLAGLGATAMLAASLVVTTLPAQARVSEVFYGRVIHVSTDNIKVRNPHGKVLSFVFVPSVAKVVTDSGKPQAVTDIRDGQHVKVVYDTTALGIRHLDRVVELRRMSYMPRH